MGWVVLVVRVLVGAGFALTGLDHFVHFLPKPEIPSPAAGAYIGAIGPTGYMTAVKALELVGGLLLLSGRLAPLGITLLMPVAVNIMLYEVFLTPHPVGPGGVLTGLLLFLVWGYRKYFGPIFTATATTRSGGWLSRLRG